MNKWKRRFDYSKLSRIITYPIDKAYRNAVMFYSTGQYRPYIDKREQTHVGSVDIIVRK